jgi:hypothetical protein
MRLECMNAWFGSSRKESVHVHFRGTRKYTLIQGKLYSHRYSLLLPWLAREKNDAHSRNRIDEIQLRRLVQLEIRERERGLLGDYRLEEGL